MKTLSRGQYELVRASVARDKRSQSGLELNVRDYVNGTERPVASLSGGEAFLASMSLALGMSDEIQTQEGGIELDASLSMKALTLWMKTCFGLPSVRCNLWARTTAWWVSSAMWQNCGSVLTTRSLSPKRLTAQAEHG